MIYARSCLALVTMLLMACASPKVQEVRPAIQAPSLDAHKIVMRDGSAMPMKQWLPEGQMRAVILALHGFNDYHHAFEPLGVYATHHDIGVIAYDQRGFGASLHKGIWGGERLYVRDCYDAVRSVRARYPDVPLYLMGESMGGAIAMMTVAEHPNLPIDGLILSAPAVWGQNSMRWFYRVPLWLAAHTFPSWRASGGNLDIYASDNFPMLVKMGRDPHVIHKTRIDSMYGIVGLMDKALPAASRITHPTLVLYGANDEVIPKAPSYAAMHTLQDQYHAYYDRGFHLLTRDLQGDVVMRDIVAWIGNHHAPLPSGADREVASRMQDDIKFGRRFKVHGSQITMRADRAGAMP